MSFFKRLLEWIRSWGTEKPPVVEPPLLEAPTEPVWNPQLTANFHIDEFACKDGTPVPVGCRTAVLLLANELQTLRDVLRVPITVVDGYRTADYNRYVGGAEDSSHLNAGGADIRTRLDPHDLAQEIAGLIAQGKMARGAIIVYADRVHYDITGAEIFLEG